MNFGVRKNEIKKAEDHDLVCDAIHTFGLLCRNMQFPDAGVKRYSQHFDDLAKEMVARGILTQKDVDWINM